jgi:GntR family transcriptional regulator
MYVIYTIYIVNNFNLLNEKARKMKILIANSSRDPIYEQISKQIRSQIIAGDMKEGDPLPSIRNLASELQVSVITTKRAYETLEREGYIDTVTGRGTFVAAQNKELLREIKMKIIEDRIGEAVSDAKLFGISLSELTEMLNLLYGDEE